MSYIFDVSKGGHFLMAYPYMLSSTFTYTPHYPNTYNYITDGKVTAASAIYEVRLHNAEHTYLYGFSSEENNFSSKQLLPMATRYADRENGVYIIERPPFQIPIDYYQSKNFSAKAIASLKNRYIWIPWTVLVVSMGKNIDNLYCRLYFNNKPLSSLEDLVVKGYTPNLFDDARICFGNSQFTFAQRITSGEVEYNISNICNYLFNDYFTQWNADIHSRCSKMIFEYVFSHNKEIGDRILQTPRCPKNIDQLNYWNHYKKSWPLVLYTLSMLSFEETMDLVEYLKNLKNLHNQLLNSKSVSDVLSRSEKSSIVRGGFDPSHFNMRELYAGKRDMNRYIRHYCQSYPLLQSSIKVIINNVPPVFANPYAAPLSEQADHSLNYLFRDSKIHEMVYLKFFESVNNTITAFKDAHSLMLKDITNNQDFNLDTIFGFRRPPIVDDSALDDYFSTAFSSYFANHNYLHEISFDYADLTQGVQHV